MRMVKILEGCTRAEDDFRMSETAQVYALDVGSVPSMIYWNGEHRCVVTVEGN